mmetsp:Transcript_33533/g.76665  ORF Transcript_33533/g.76665 Transcript_33533/m.76665 type:complete len:270 (-) Transcript_33533:168-977(-)
MSLLGDGESTSFGDEHELSKIDGLRETVEGLIPVYDELTEEQKARRRFDEERVIAEKKKAVVVSGKLDVEIIARTEADLALEKLCQTSLNTMQQALTAPIVTGLREVKDELVEADNRLTDAEAALRRNVEESEKELAALRANVLDRLQIIKEALVRETETRLKQHDATRQRFPPLFKGLREDLLLEQQRREEEAHKLRVRARALETSEISLEAMAQKQIREETSQFAHALYTEKKERINRLVEVSTTVEQYSTALAHGLSIVNRSDPYP